MLQQEEIEISGRVKIFLSNKTGCSPFPVTFLPINNPLAFTVFQKDT
jgi:hypothetical protein